MQPQPEYKTKKLRVKEPSTLSSLLGLIVDPFATANRLMSSPDLALLFAYTLCLMSLAAAWLWGPYLLMQASGINLRMDRVLQLSLILIGSSILTYLLTAVIFFILGLRVQLFKLFCLLWFGFAPILYGLIAASIYNYATAGTFDLHLALIGSGVSPPPVWAIIAIFLTLALSITAFAGAIASQCDYPISLAGIFGIFCIAIFYLSLVITANIANEISPGYSLGLQSLVARVPIMGMLGINLR